ncbi:MAG: hypothetical protein KatS3mg130_1391 [Candidatus Sumerlaea sp.]|nr:MAG: hypothetical protein KatS3mg130_1391 [Candidatus Sumerlaea sp.]
MSQLTRTVAAVEFTIVYSNRARRWLIALLLAHVAYAVAFIWRSSFVVQGERFFCLFDDAMISMRYARNLAHGHGLVWNPTGERVEGFTNPLWTLIMAGWHLIPWPMSKASLPIQITSECCLLANLLILARIARQRLSEGFALLSVACAAFYYPLNNWALQGMEVGLLALLFSAGVWSTWQCERSRLSPWIALLPSAVAMLVRPDAAVAHLVFAFYLLWRNPEKRPVIVAAAFVWLLVCVGGQTLFRWVYYGDLAPNTYYLKMTGFPVFWRMTRGTLHAAWFWAKFLWPFAALALWHWVTVSRRTGPAGEGTREESLRRISADTLAPSLLLLGLVGAQTLYSCYVGGDAWERIAGANRFIAPVVPFAFILAFGTLEHLGGVQRLFSRGRSLGLIAYGFAGLVNPNMFFGPSSLAYLVLLEPPLYKADNERNVRLALALREFTQPHATVAVDYAGAPAYFADRQMIDLLGKADRHVARLPAHRNVLGVSRFLEYYPGHLKWDYKYSIGELQPDVVCAIWRRTLGDSHRHLHGTYLQGEIAGFSVYLKKGSPAIRWDQIPFTPTEVAAP